MQVISQNIDGGATEADGGASAPVGPSVATPLDGNDMKVTGGVITFVHLCKM